ncbi:uncharacterized protein PGRI_070750 [Penicillium griseofulvum]|uniref:F-box domain-containing protein n=1 Tax=Penicillium patulum TaxID=5078 RepID=A0A135LKM8_PENPA|nr:uncharacterized protein PGRI_070750 [Penicillium griseofulvum]KXG49494.1 hypothetical protein PGRI_070750 [Penicillium griseofulvum]
MSFLALPSEIHELVISYIPSSQDVASLSISCRTLHIVCDMETRKRFHRIRISNTDESRNVAFDLFMAILKRPLLGRYVRHIECAIPVAQLMNYREGEHQRHLGHNDISRVRAAIRKAGFTGLKQDRILNMLMQRKEIKTTNIRGKNIEFEYGWPKLSASELVLTQNRECVTRGCFVSQALTAILITVAPHLESMAVTVPTEGQYSPVSEWPLLQLLRQTNADPESKPFLRNLHTVHIIHLNFRAPGDISANDTDFIRFFHLFDNFLSMDSFSTPKLRQHGVGIQFLDEQELSSIVRTSNVSKMSVLHSAANSTCLAVLISSCKALREFQYSNIMMPKERGVREINVKAFVKAICLHKSTLEVLDVDFDVTCEPQLKRMEHDVGLLDREGGPLDLSEDELTRAFLQFLWNEMGSLKDFAVLKRLSMGIQTLLYFAKGEEEGHEKEKFILADCLPDSLHYLCVRGYERGKNSEHDAQMDALRSFYDSGLSKLREIRGIDECIPNSPLAIPDE